MYTPNGRISKRKTVQLMVALTILAWATETLMHQWGYGAEVTAAAQSAAAQVGTGQAAAGQAGAGQAGDAEPQEKFLPADPQGLSATIEMRGEATIVGGDLKLKQVCRWSDADNAAMAPLADLIIAHMDPAKPFKSISVDDIKQTLTEAGVNISGINFVGTMKCTINRSDAQYDPHAGLNQWIDARSGDPAAANPPAAASTPAAPAAPAAQMAAVQVGAQSPAEPALAKPQSGEDKPYHTLRELLTANVADRLNLPVDSLQMEFKPLDDKVLNLCEPHFKFQIEPTRVRNLGTEEWDVTIITANGNQELTLSADARAWEAQAVLVKPLAYHQLIQETDITDKRALVELLPDNPLVTKTQAVGTQASRDLKPGTVLDARMLDPVEMVRTGEFVTITVANGGVSIKTVARAMEGGSLGQTIKVKNETTHDIYDVVISGPQQASLNANAPPSAPGNVAMSN
jgi:flagella basal body P-ring formation protein FlgA